MRFRVGFVAAGAPAKGKKALAQKVKKAQAVSKGLKKAGRVSTAKARYSVRFFRWVPFLRCIYTSMVQLLPRIEIDFVVNIFLSQAIIYESLFISSRISFSFLLFAAPAPSRRPGPPRPPVLHVCGPRIPSPLSTATTSTVCCTSL